MLVSLWQARKKKKKRGGESCRQHRTFINDALSGIQRERDFHVSPYFEVPVAETSLAVLVDEDGSAVVAEDRVRDDDVMHRRDDEHRGDVEDEFLALLQRQALRPGGQPRDVLVRVHHVDVAVGRDADDAVAWSETTHLGLSCPADATRVKTSRSYFFVLLS